MPYVDFIPATFPPWLRGPWGTKFGQSVGQRLDDVAQDHREAVFVRFPGICDDSALDLIGADRLLPRGPGESNDAYRARLNDAWTAWAGDDTPLIGTGGGAGSPLGLLRQLKIAGIPTATIGGAVIVQQNGKSFRLDNLGGFVVGDLMTCVNRQDLTGAVNPRPGWTFDGRDNFYSAFAIVFPQPTTPIDGGLLNSIVKQWKPAKAIYVGAVILGAGSLLLGWPADNARTLGSEPALGTNVGTYLPPPDGEETLVGFQSGF